MSFFFAGFFTALRCCSLLFLFWRCVCRNLIGCWEAHTPHWRQTHLLISSAVDSMSISLRSNHTPPPRSQNTTYMLLWEKPVWTSFFLRSIFAKTWQLSCYFGEIYCLFGTDVCGSCWTISSAVFLSWWLPMCLLIVITIDAVFSNAITESQHLQNPDCVYYITSQLTFLSRNIKAVEILS